MGDTSHIYWHPILIVKLEGSKYGIRVVGVAPGPIAGTEGGPTGRVFGGALKTTTVADQIPIARWG